VPSLRNPDRNPQESPDVLYSFKPRTEEERRRSKNRLKRLKTDRGTERRVSTRKRDHRRKKRRGDSKLRYGDPSYPGERGGEKPQMYNKENVPKRRRGKPQTEHQSDKNKLTFMGYLTNCKESSRGGNPGGTQPRSNQNGSTKVRHKDKKRRAEGLEGLVQP